PREEQAITGAIRNVLGGGKERLCFTAGHGEMSLEDGSEKGLGYFKDILDKNNYDSVTVDTTRPDLTKPFDGCRVVVLAAPVAAFTKEEAARLRAYLDAGGNLFAAISPSRAEKGE